jgi:hypothetical protein
MPLRLNSFNLKKVPLTVAPFYPNVATLNYRLQLCHSVVTFSLSDRILWYWYDLVLEVRGFSFDVRPISYSPVISISIRLFRSFFTRGPPSSNSRRQDQCKGEKMACASYR